MNSVLIATTDRYVDVDSPAVIDVEYAPIQVVEVATVGPQGPQGPVADLGVVLGFVDTAVQDYFVLHPQSFTYDHPTETYVWTILHPLDHLPAVTVIDSAGTEIIGVESWPAQNIVRIEFNTPQAGTAVLT